MLESMSFGSWLRQKRRALDLTQKALADQVGCAEITVRRMEADEYKPSNELAHVLFEKLGIPEPERTQWVRFARGLAQYTKHHLTSSPPRQQKTNLPIPLTSFIGREKEIETVKHLIAPHGEDRLVTLTGAGGSGKTRLALEVAATLREVFPDGVWFIEFAPLTDPALVPQSLLTALGLNEQANRSALPIVADFLQPKRVLLVLDNCEHLIQACAELTETLLQACPTLHILATSREALSVAGETIYLVPTLTTPDPAKADLATLPQYEAVRLFVGRAQTALPGFALTNDNAPAVAEVCHQLDGIPLALELAAARVKALRVEQIAARLAERDQFRLLTTGSRTALPRHQTLDALIDWSYNLLSEDERLVLQRLSVFAGGWTLKAAEAVCAGEGVEAGEVLDLMSQLVNKSLVISERAQGQEARYHMLETIRQYASERLLEASKGEQLRNRHLDFFLYWAERAESKLRGPQRLEWLDQIETEHDNLRAALEWSLAQAERGEDSLHLASALIAFWQQRGHVSEGRTWLGRALASQATPPAGAARARALYASGYLAHAQGDTTAAKAVLEESAGLWRALGVVGQTGLAYALTSLGGSLRDLGDPAAARSIVGEAIALFREQDDRWGLAYALCILSLAIRDQDNYALARSVIDESVALWQDLGDQWGLRLSNSYLGEVAMREGDYEVARRHYADCLTIARMLRDKEAVAWGLLNLGLVSLNLGDRVRAKSFFEESFSLVRESGNKSGLAMSFYYFGYLAHFEGDNEQAKSFFEQELVLARTVAPIWLRSQALFGLAGVAAAGGQALRAARLLGAAKVQEEVGATYIDAADSLFNGRTSASAIAILGEAAFAEAYSYGRAMTFEQAADYALETEPSA
jgi:predicted ATPase/transcriptional regulator with XRE-family HTH domain